MNQENKFNFSAVLWDFDGTIADTQIIHANTEVEIMKKYGIDISSEEITRRFSGVKLKVIFQTIFDENNVVADVQEACEAKWHLMNKLLRQELPEFMPGAKELLDKLYNADIKMALATSSIKSYVDFIVDALLIRNKFQLIITGDDVERGKPDPEIFIKAASAIGVENEKCLVIEDGNAGVLAAQAANMKCIAAGDHIDKSILTEKSIYVDTLEIVDFDFLSKLV